jgi:hypothetical protein
MNKTQLLIRDLVLLLFAILVTSLLGCQDDAPDSALMAPSTESTGATNVGRTSITVAGRYLGNLDKITEYGVKYSTSNNFPSDATTYVRFTGSPTSIVSAVLEGLSANTHYYYSWYATTGATEVSSSYGEFTTTATSKPQFSELSVDSVAENYALIRCRVLDVGDDYLVEGGIAYRIKTSSSSERYTQVAADEVDANNEYTVVLNELSAGTTYEVRAYAKNGSDAEGENGMMESYGETITFSTDNQLAPELEAYDPTDVGMSSARVIAKVTAAKGSNGVYTERGFCYSTTSQDPTIYDNFHKVDGTDFEAFAVVFTGLQQQTTYYVRAYAKNIVDGAERVGYSSRMEFTTSALATPLVYFSDDYESTSTASTIKVQAYIDNYDANALTEKGFFWSTDDSNVTLETAKKNNQYLVVTTGDKVFSGTITGLKSNTTYRIKAYATVEASGETLTGSTEARYFYTNQNNSATLKDIETTGSTISSITMKTGISSLNEGTLVEKGFCWKVWKGNWDLSLDNCEGSLKSDGDNDSYTATITGLASNTIYLIEGYVKTEIEGETLVGYSSSVTVSTSSLFYGHSSSGTTSSSITLTVYPNGLTDSDILEKGFVWRIYDETNEEEVTLENCEGSIKVDSKFDSNENSYSGTIENLLPSTTYILRAYIKFTDGDQTLTGYGDSWTISTKAEGTVPSIDDNVSPGKKD